MDNYTGGSGDAIAVTINVSNPYTAIDAFTLDFTFDPLILGYVEYSIGSLDPGWLAIEAIEIEPGKIRMGAYTMSGYGIPEGNTGSLIDLHFVVLCDGCETGTSCALIPERLLDDLKGFYVLNGTFTFTNEPTPTPVCIHNGDVNFDGLLTSADAQLAFFIVLGMITPTPEETCAADCNASGTVTAGDAQKIFGAVLGIDTCADPI